MSCIFCKIVSGQISSTKLFEDAQSIVIKDVNPQAKRHFLVIPKVHHDGMHSLFPKGGDRSVGESLMGHLLGVAAQVAHDQGLLPSGFRTVINTGQGGGQTVFHLHVHLLGGGPVSERMA